MLSDSFLNLKPKYCRVDKHKLIIKVYLKKTNVLKKQYYLHFLLQSSG